MGGVALLRGLGFKQRAAKAIAKEIEIRFEREGPALKSVAQCIPGHRQGQ